MTLLPFLSANPNPTEAEIRQAISGNLCRCTGYQHIVDAVLLAAQASRVAAHAFWSRLHEADLGAVQAALARLRAGTEDSVRAECRMRRADGAWRWMDLNALVADRTADGEPLRIVATMRDVQAEHEAGDRQQVADSLFRQLHEGLLITDEHHRVLEVNPTFCRMSGLPRGELLGRVPTILRAAPDDAHGPLSGMHAALASEGMWRGEVLHQRPDGAFATLLLAVSAVRGHDGSLRSHVVAVTDVTLERQQQERIARQAHFDELTRLPNRTRLSTLLQEALAACERDGALLTVCHLDLDHFRQVNERHGRDAGDRLIAALAERVRASLRTWAGGDDVAARIGGDEFALLLRTATLRESHHAVERVLQQISQPCDIGLPEGPLSVTASIGATVFPYDRSDGEALLRHADQALYGAKQAGRNGYLFFDADQDRRAKARFVALGRVQEALDASEFSLHYQPKIDMRGRRVIGAEALLRWHHPEHGLVPPGQFLPLVEHTGLGVALGRWVLARGVSQLSAWLRQGLTIDVSINVSARHLQEPSFADELAALLGQHGADVAPHLVLEVLETAALADVDYTCELMQRCRSLGVRVALDDFGTGYSALNYLARFRVDCLKIDKSFVQGIGRSERESELVKAFIAMAAALNLDLVAEGVETDAQAAFLLENGCQHGQGYRFGRPMPVAEFERFVSRCATA